MWLELGLGSDPVQFFRLTPRLLDIAVAARTKAAIADYDRQVEIAWLTAMLGRVKKPPALADLRPKPKTPAKAMPWQAMLKSAEAWAAAA